MRTIENQYKPAVRERARLTTITRLVENDLIVAEAAHKWTMEHVYQIDHNMFLVGRT